MRVRTMCAVGAVLAMVLPATAQAATHVSPTQTVSYNRELQMMGGVSTAGAPFSSSATYSAGAALFDAFDANLGVLVAANRNFTGSISLRSSLLFDTDFASSPTNYYAPGQSAQGSAAGYFKDSLSNPSPILGTLNHTLSCTADQTGSCFTEKTTTAVATGSVQLTGSALNSLTTSSGATNIFFETGQYAWDAESSNDNGFIQLFNYLKTTGTESINYEYMDHANASFSPFADLDILTLDFGTLAQNSGTASKVFSLSNLGDAFTVGLDLDSFIFGDQGPFSTTLAAFSGLESGGQLGFNAYFDTGTQGAFSVDYVLNLSDANIGVGLATSQMKLRLTGVVGPGSPTGPCATRVCASPTPEPSTWATLLLGFGAVGGAMRVRRRLELAA